MLIQSVEQGWIDINTYAFTAFMHCQPLDYDEVVDLLAGIAAEHGILTTRDLALANELLKQIWQERRQPKKWSWWSWLTG